MRWKYKTSKCMQTLLLLWLEITLTHPTLQLTTCPRYPGCHTVQSLGNLEESCPSSPGSWLMLPRFSRMHKTLQ